MTPESGEPQPGDTPRAPRDAAADAPVAMRAVDRSVLDLDATAECARIEASLRQWLRAPLRRRGYVVAVSGGIDSAVCLTLAVRALGASRTHALLLPERDSDPAAMDRARRLVARLGVAHEERDITPALEAVGCYAARDAAIRAVVPGYGPDWRCKLVAADAADAAMIRQLLVVESPAGRRERHALRVREYLAIIAATSFKQRLRKTMEFHAADRLNYAVLGTPNRLELDLGFFVKNGDGAADVKPIGHLFKSQVYQLAACLDVAQEIRSAAPSTDTYSLPQTQDEFYFELPLADLDLALWAFDRDVPAEALAPALGMSAAGVERVYHDLRAKRRVAAYLRAPPLLVDDVP